MNQITKKKKNKKNKKKLEGESLKDQCKCVHK